MAFSATSCEKIESSYTLLNIIFRYRRSPYIKPLKKRLPSFFPKIRSKRAPQPCQLARIGGTGYNPNKKGDPLPRPDFVINEKGATIAILDAKYRDLWEKRLPREMLYQLGMYALVHNDVRSSTILYPTMNDDASEEKILINDPVSGSFHGSVTVRPVCVHQLDELIQMPVSRSTNRIKEKYTRYMVFGEKHINRGHGSGRRRRNIDMQTS